MTDQAMRAIARDRANRKADTEHDQLRMDAIRAQRELLATLRRQGKIPDHVHRLEEELDWAELHASLREIWNCWMRRTKLDMWDEG